MSYAMADRALVLAAAYLAIGALVAAPFVIFGVGRIDPAAKSAPWTFRLLILPGAVALWPVLLRRWMAARRSS